ncbi:MAG: hypothetical protein K0S24_1960 [Sphingobacterium sp.]|jgi:type I restriction enzyme S subunit|nr:hypothetical protein [Sphingobacterium sp.]
MEKLLPKGWEEINLKESVDFRKGKKPKVLSKEYFEGAVPYLDILGLERNIVSFYADSESAKYFKNNDVVIVWDGSRSGLILKPKSGAIGSTLGALSPYGYKSDFLYYFLLSQYEVINSKARGVGIPHVDPTYLWGLQLPLPPLAEQDRIVAKLDTLFAQHKKIKVALDRIPKLLKTFRQQVLARAVTGKLLKPKDIGNFNDYSINVITGPFGSALHKSDYVYDGIPVINPSHIKNGRIYVDPKISINTTKFESLKPWHLLKGDVVLGRRGEMGRAAPVERSNSMLCGTGAVILRSTKIDPLFLTLYLRSEICVSFLTSNSVGSTMINLNQKILKSLPIPLYSLEEQQEIVRRVESLFAKADVIETRYQRLKAKVDKLPQAILHKAFKGELVSQLPTDGDAKDLLEEIMAVRAEPKGKKRKESI